MAGNSFGRLFNLTTYGESHGPALGGVIDGCPSGIKLDLDDIQNELNRRKPGQSAIVTQRKEPDTVKFYSGIFEGVTTGTSIGFVIENTNQKSHDYSHIKDSYRPSHADYTYDKKYGVRDYRGGGRSSARETACRVVAGAVAKQMLNGIHITAYVSGVEVRGKGDTVGGIVSCVIQNVPVGLGEPVFDKLHAELGKAMLSINAVKGFEYGSGFHGSTMYGSDHNDSFNTDGSTKTNFSGGIQGGISNGMDIYFNVAFKPVATLIQEYETIDKEGKVVQMHGKGRHDPCVVPRAVPIVEAMAALVIADFFLINKVYS
ncbi:UNVERIFIED_CONTAM: hypothetical protein GTU68_063106 [Idotea baltica]|nr:hypothetical protein [Idotea baltica]